MWNASWFEGMWTVKDFVWEKSLLCRLLLYVPMFWAPLSCVLSCFYMTRVCSLISKFCCHRLYRTGCLEITLGSSAFVLNNATTVPLLFNRELWFSWNEILLTLLETLGFDELEGFDFMLYLLKTNTCPLCISEVISNPYVLWVIFVCPRISRCLTVLFTWEKYLLVVCLWVVLWSQTL
jgi:hypothetical protein